MMNIHGTFYEMPRDDSGGLAKIRPIATHNRRIFDFASWRGMLVLSGNLAAAEGTPRRRPTATTSPSDDGKVGPVAGQRRRPLETRPAARRGRPVARRGRHGQASPRTRT